MDFISDENMEIEIVYSDDYILMPGLEDCRICYYRLYNNYIDDLTDIIYFNSINKYNKMIIIYKNKIKNLRKFVKRINNFKILKIDKLSNYMIIYAILKVNNIYSNMINTVLYVLFMSGINYDSSGNKVLYNISPNDEIIFFNYCKNYKFESNIQRYLQKMYMLHNDDYNLYINNIEYLFEHDDIDDNFKKSLKKYCTYRGIEITKMDINERYKYATENCEIFTVHINCMKLSLPKIIISIFT